MPSITPYLWFDSGAEDAAKFYVSIFKNSSITSTSYYGEAGPGPVGSAMVVEFSLDGQDFMAINAPSGSGQAQSADEFSQGKVALYVDCETQADVDAL